MSNPFVEDSASEQIEQKSQEIERLKSEKEQMKQEAREKFATVKAKLDAEREKTASLEKELEEARRNAAVMQNQIEEYKKTMQNYENASINLSDANLAFISSLGEALGCGDQKEILPKVKELAALPPQIEKLKSELAKASAQLQPKQPQTEDQARRRLSTLIEDLITVERYLGPDNLSLKHPEQEQLRQLFAGLCNVIRVVAREQSDREMLEPYLRALVYQARQFSQEKSVRESQEFDRSVAAPFMRRMPTGIDSPTLSSNQMKKE